MGKLIKITATQELELNNIFIKPSTVRKWNHAGKLLEVIIKLNNRLYIDVDAWQRLVVDPALLERDKKVSRLKNINNIIR